MSGTTSDDKPRVDRLALINDFGAIVISLIVVGAFAIVMYLQYTHKIDDNASFADMRATLNTLTAAVVYFWIGSSAGSKAKDRLLAQPTTNVTTNAPETTVNANPPVRPAGA